MRFANSVEFYPDEPAQPPKPPSAHVALASAHYSLVKRYMSPKWKLPLAVWHLWRATSHARKADSLGLQNYDQMDVVSTILAKSPRLLGGALHYAHKILVEALYGVNVTARQEVMKPHTRALMLVSLGEIEMKLGAPLAAVRCYKSTEQVLPDITDERQKCRVMRSLGTFYVEHGEGFDEWQEGRFLLTDAIKIARVASYDQLEAIHTELPRLSKIMDERGLELDVQ